MYLRTFFLFICAFRCCVLVSQGQTTLIKIQIYFICMIQDTVRTWYVIYMYPIHGQDTRNTGLYKRSKTNHHKKTFTKIFSLEIFFFFSKYLSDYVNAKLQQFPTAVKTHRWWSAPSSGPETTFVCATCRLHSFHDIHLQFYCVKHWTFSFLWQVPTSPSCHTGLHSNLVSFYL